MGIQQAFIAKRIKRRIASQGRLIVGIIGCRHIYASLVNGWGCPSGIIYRYITQSPEYLIVHTNKITAGSFGIIITSRLWSKYPRIYQAYLPESRKLQRAAAQHGCFIYHINRRSDKIAAAIKNDTTYIKRMLIASHHWIIGKCAEVGAVGRCAVIMVKIEKVERGQ